jgi:hypothetical protein
MTVKKDPMSISNSESRTAEANPRKEQSTALRAGSIGVLGILFFVLSAQAPLTGIVGAAPWRLHSAMAPGHRALTSSLASSLSSSPSGSWR